MSGARDRDDALVRIKGALETGGAEHAAAYIAHIEIALKSRSGSPVSVPRTIAQLDNVLGRAPYLEHAGALTELTRSNCHIGQRKLALALIEFLNISARVHETTDLFVVYPGASILACLAAADLYPTARFLCFDPAYDATVTNVRHELGRRADAVMRHTCIIRSEKADRVTALEAFANGQNIVVYTDQAGMYGDESHTLAKAVHANLHDLDGRKREMVFCSDVRMTTPAKLGADPSELQIAGEMVSQALWTRNLGVKCFQLKFRMPYGLDPEIEALYEGLCTSIPAGCGNSGNSSKGPSLPYLDGDCYVQLYARETSAELRLVGTDGVKLKRYALRTIEETMAAFNTVHRAHTCFKPRDTKAVPDEIVRVIADELSPPSIPCVSYDALCEGAIIFESIMIAGGPRDPIQQKRTLQQKMRSFSSLYASGRHPKTCAVKKSPENLVGRPGKQGKRRRKPVNRKRFAGGMARSVYEPRTWHSAVASTRGGAGSDRTQSATVLIATGGTLALWLAVVGTLR